METPIRIAMVELPEALRAVLQEQLRNGYEVLHAVPETNTPLPDLVLAGEGYRGGEEFFPVLRVPTGTPCRLGDILLQMHHALNHPAAYVGKIALRHGVDFLPERKVLRGKNGQEVALTDREADILFYLARHSSRAPSRQALLQNVWNYHEGVDTHTLETHIYRLRQKIEKGLGAEDIITTTSEGYGLALRETP